MTPPRKARTLRPTARRWLRKKRPTEPWGAGVEFMGGRLRRASIAHPVGRYRLLPAAFQPLLASNHGRYITASFSQLIHIISGIERARPRGTREMASPRIERALISVSDKSGLAALAQGLTAAGVELYSTGGTRRFLESE